MNNQIIATSISLVRHGRVHNPQGIYYGRLPGFRLSADGIHQAELAAEVFCHRALGAVYSSPLLRTRQTARIILKHHPHLRLRTSKFLIEVHTPFDGYPLVELDARRWDLYTGTDSHYEQPGDVVSRMATFLHRVRRRHPGEHIVLVTHGDVITFTILWAKNVPITARNKRRLEEIGGIPDTYPAEASISTLTYRTAHPDEIPQLEYVRSG